MQKIAKRWLEWTKSSQRHLAEIEAYIEQDNPVAAQAVISHIMEIAEQLILFPLSGRPIGRQGVRTRVIIRYPYALYYRLKPGKIQMSA
ncbi:MAG: type II toxin-antitoxin system RelE/ParE family toxin [Sulfuricella sp.]